MVGINHFLDSDTTKSESCARFLLRLAANSRLCCRVKCNERRNGLSRAELYCSQASNKAFISRDCAQVPTCGAPKAIWGPRGRGLPKDE